MFKSYSRKMLDENKLKEFIDIQNPKEIIKSCYILMRGEAIVYVETYFGITFNLDATIFRLNSLFVNMNESFKFFLLDKGIGRLTTRPEFTGIVPVWSSLPRWQTRSSPGHWASWFVSFQKREKKCQKKI